MIVMVTATLLFALAAIVGYGGYDDGETGVAELLLVLCAFAALTLGGWIGGSIVFVHGMRVLELAGGASRPRDGARRRGEGPRRGRLGASTTSPSPSAGPAIGSARR
jgi:hypothetical protein